ncbi:MAG TPA: hypothetical protein VGX95_15320 [Xanthobacteraceae bacterium]|nr:hypothetical protein [Xanthobacteraceae bacterium]
MESKPMLEPRSSIVLMSPRAHLRAEALLRSRAAEIVAAVVRHAEAGDRAAIRLARQHGLPIGPPPKVLAARLAVSIERTRATVATLLAEGGIARARAGAQVIVFSDVKTRRRAGGRVLQCNGRGGGTCKYQRKYKHGDAPRCGGSRRGMTGVLGIIGESGANEDAARQQEPPARRK